ncbi:zinc dependent phospholipase C family protein [Paenibacillus contaminans]|uniref:Hydrolase n=1 Tax=Paenibacillus contaminans TaxID=450362 RepID=A0A329M9V1_9BACL|nr:zinc dependent phospholipase C family protein [Paenibacillus contaminans]RAV16761.1 hydrolase [Paenibacillus contaminans]
MGSRIMHLIIANRIAERLSIKDKAAFLIGGVAPDAVSTKDASHFFKGDHQDYSRFIDYKGFWDTYRSQAKNHYILGYFTHLIADDMWLQGFYIPWLRNRMEADQELYPLYHNDFRLLNGKLLEYYNCTDELKQALVNPPTVCDIEEVKSKDVEAFIPSVLGDMEYDQEVLHAKLNVFTFNQIVGYIETSVNKGVLNIQSILA